MLKVQNGFNDNNAKNNGIDNKNKNSLSFTGHKVIQNENGDNLYRFYLPALEKGDKASVHIVLLVKDKKGNYRIIGEKDADNKHKPVKVLDFKPGKNYVDREFELLGLDDDPNAAIGYKFVINGKEYLDSTLLTHDRNWNIAIPPNRPVLEASRSMYHIMPDLMISQKTKEKNPDIYDARRTHFNKFGGNIDGIIERVDYINKDVGARRILSTPIFGQDNLSSHGYWTTNPYQITDGLGDISKFNRLNAELFKRGMGWIADGAFVNEGLEGIHTEHIGKWGTQSPYIDWLTTFSFPDKPFKFGILPKKEDAAGENLGIRLVNADYKLHVNEKTGEAIWEENTRDESKPSYVQVYDKRLATPDQINSDEVIRSYGSKNAKDPNEINSYMDSIVPYRFKINPGEVKQKFKTWEEAKKTTKDDKLPFSNFLTEWTNFGMTSSDSDGGTTLWVGNKDISKLRFMLTEQDKAKIRFRYGKDAEAKINRVEQSVNQVQDNIVQVGEFWTNNVAKTLYEHTAKQLAKAKAENYENKIKEKVEDKELPEEALKVTKEHIENLIDKKEYTLKTAPVPQNVTEGLMSYPFDAIEFNSGMSAILGSPFLKKLAISEDQIGKSRYEIFAEEKDKQEDKYKDSVLEEFRPAYRKMDNLISDTMAKKAVEILKEVEDTKKLKVKLFEEGTENLTEDGKELYSLVSNDVAKFIVTQGLLTEAGTHAPHLFENENLSPNYDNKDSLEYNRELLERVSPQSLDINASNPAQEAEILISRLKSGIEMISNEDKQNFADHLANRLAGLDGNTVKVAKLVVDKAEGGLEWRIDAAKDVCPVEDIHEGKADFEANWDKGVKFWNKFTEGVRKYNPRAYEILEVTDEGKLVQASQYRSKYTNAHEASLKLIHGSGATTPTNYNYLYSEPQSLYGVFTEPSGQPHHDNVHWYLKGKMFEGWDAGEPNHTKGMLESSSMDTILNYHNSIGNHDKPRYAHLAGLDGSTFYNNGKTAAMNSALEDSFKKAYTENNVPDNVQAVIEKALGRLAKGEYNFKDGSRIDEKTYDPDLFGARPYDVNIKDVIKEARLQLEKENKTETSEYEYLADETKVKSLQDDTLKHMLKPALKRYEAIIGLLVGMPGNPTVYAGDEIGETGWETPNKNTYVQNRNLIHYERIDSIPEIKKTKEKVQALMNLRNDSRLSPLVNGTTVFVADSDADSRRIAALYRYNDKKDMFVLYTNNHFDSNRDQCGDSKGQAMASIPKLNLDQEYSLNKKATDNKAQKTESIMKNIPAGTKYRNALENNSDVYYEVKEEGSSKYLQKVEKGKDINLDMDTPYLFLYREQPSFSGNSLRQNPQVAIANLKYNIPKQ